MTGATSAANKRRASRKAVFNRARVTYDKGRTSLRCAIRDISSTGARIEISRSNPLPAIVHLVDLPQRIAYEASVVWRRPPLYGLAFVQSQPLSSADTPLYLRKLWFESVR